jgi:two-component sensor histidine kinase
LPEEDGKYSVTICDDGIGLSDHFTMKGTQTMGSQIIQILVEQIEASLEFMSNNGAYFRILFSSRLEE